MKENLIILFSEDLSQVLLTRSKDEKFKGLWEGVVSKIEKSEGPFSNALKTVKELGVNLENVDDIHHILKESTFDDRILYVSCVIVPPCGIDMIKFNLSWQDLDQVLYGEMSSVTAGNGRLVYFIRESLEFLKARDNG